jgi:hypothetical protein
MSTRLYRLDLRLAAHSDGEIEELWRTAAPGEHEIALARQLVLRALEVIELTCAEEGKAASFSPREIECASDEVALRLFARLRADLQVKNVRALAHALAREVIADLERRRLQPDVRLSERRPRLTLIEGKVER